MNNGRANQLFLQQQEMYRSLWRMAKTLEIDPNIRGLSGASWFLSADVASFFPHLAWMRAMFAEEGAYLIDLEPARDDSGLKMGSAKRRDLYAQGQFSPRRTMVLWPRNDLLAWAAQHPEYADEDDAPVTAPGGGAPVRRKAPRLPRPAPAAKHNSRLTLWDAIPLINDNPKKYAALALLTSGLAGGGGRRCGGGVVALRRLGSPSLWRWRGCFSITPFNESDQNRLLLFLPPVEGEG